MGAPFDRIDVIGEGEDVLGVAVVPLHGDFKLDTLSFTFKMDDARMNGGLGSIQVLDKRHEPALVNKLVFFLAPLVFDGDLHSAV